ncbi:Six-hairpin glycosidase, partial [Glonium stellatum]
AQDPSRPYPLADDYLRTTSILNHSKYVSSLDDYQWYLDNIPFVDFPEKTFQDVYYYRASVIKRHLKYAHEGHGWVFTEFIHPVAWASKLQTIPDSAGHHIVEGRWLRNPQYVKDLIMLYTRGGVEALSGITYTHYIHRAIFEHAEVTGDAKFLTSQLDGLISMYQLWNVQLNNDTGLYHRTPLSDAQEYSLPGYVTGGPNGGPVQEWNSFDNNYNIIWLGPETYRPNFNAYMVAAAKSIADIARLVGNETVAQEWDSTASNLYSKMKTLLWNEDLKFWIDVVEGTNLPVLGRELIGYFPFRFGVGVEDEMVKGLEAGLNGDAFVTSYGPTTLEQSNPYYTAFKNSTYCCIWQGQSWPFSTSVYLYTLAALARSNSTTSTPELFQAAFTNYTATNYKLGVPYTAESHYPTIDEWSGDSTNHSEHYLHSTYLDNVFSNLIGILPTLGDRLMLSPLVPENWDYFAHAQHHPPAPPHLQQRPPRHHRRHSPRRRDRVPRRRARDSGKRHRAGRAQALDRVPCERAEHAAFL